jgi:hypothetical protein
MLPAWFSTKHRFVVYLPSATSAMHEQPEQATLVAIVKVLISGATTL